MGAASQVIWQESVKTLSVSKSSSLSRTKNTFVFFSL